MNKVELKTLPIGSRFQSCNKTGTLMKLIVGFAYVQFDGERVYHIAPSSMVMPVNSANLHFNYNDGGREAAGYKGKAGACVCRAICIAANLPYADVYERLAIGNATQRQSKYSGKQPRSARNGIHVKRKWFRDYMKELGFEWTPTMFIGSGCKVHVESSELPSGRLVLALSKHWSSMIDGVINDTYDCSRNGTRCVYGYWTFKG